ncbi:MAG: class I SAM-dependent methyltransferase [Clostridiales bacterium]|jgi:tRNA G10  N-methylase Trm11|nr:class I SAM-dependent methyltransferase [Clostridiales bacterium]
MEKINVRLWRKEDFDKKYQEECENGIEKWGIKADNQDFKNIVIKWLSDNNLLNKKIIDFACGKAHYATWFCKLGCKYHGLDISPTAVQIAKDNLKNYSSAVIFELNIVDDVNVINEKYDAAFDAYGFYLLQKDDRRKYLKNAYACLRNGAPMLFIGLDFLENGDSSEAYKTEIETAGFNVEKIDEYIYESFDRIFYVRKPLNAD